VLWGNGNGFWAQKNDLFNIGMAGACPEQEEHREHREHEGNRAGCSCGSRHDGWLAGWVGVAVFCAAPLGQNSMVRGVRGRGTRLSAGVEKYLYFVLVPGASGKYPELACGWCCWCHARTRLLGRASEGACTVQMRCVGSSRQNPCPANTHKTTTSLLCPRVHLSRTFRSCLATRPY
jgi:hypothetical protein